MPGSIRVLLAASLVLTPLGNARAQGTMDFAPVNVEEDKEAQAELEEALKSYKKRDFLRASLILYRVVSRSEVAVTPAEQKAEYTLAKTLYKSMSGVGTDEKAIFGCLRNRSADEVRLTERARAFSQSWVWK